MRTVSLSAALARIDAPWDPKIIAELNGQHVKLAKLEGDFVWHRHDAADELFLVLEGTLVMQLEDGEERLGPGELIVIPRGVRHCPRSDGGCAVLLFEPAGTLNTGDVRDERTVDAPERI